MCGVDDEESVLDPICLIESRMGNLWSVSQCVNIASTEFCSMSQNKHLKIMVSGSDASSIMLPVELAVSESESGMANRARSNVGDDGFVLV